MSELNTMTEANTMSAANITSQNTQRAPVTARSRRMGSPWQAGLVLCVALIGCTPGAQPVEAEPASGDSQAAQAELQGFGGGHPGELRTKRVHVTGPLLGQQKVAYWDTGVDAPAIVFVHSNSCAKECWERQFAELGVDGLPNPLREFRLIALDLPGHGQTRRTDGQLNTYSIGLYAEAVTEFSAALGLTGAVYVGHSLGGHAVIEAGQHLTAPAGAMIYGTPPVSTLEQLGAAFFPMPGGPHYLIGDLSARDIHHWEATVFYSELPSWFARTVRRADPRARAELPLSFGVLADEVQMVRDYPCPFAIVHGEHERSVRGTYLESLNLGSELWRGGVQYVAESNHFVSYDQPVVFNNLVNELASEVTAP